MNNRKSIFSSFSYFFILPGLLWVGFVYLYPIVRMIWYSLVNWTYLTPDGFNWFKNFVDLIKTRYFFTTLSNNLFIIVGVIPVTIAIALFFCQFIYLKIRGYKFYTFIFFIPVVLPDIVVAEIMISFLNKVGPLNTFFTKVGLDFLVVDWLGNPRFSLLAIIISIIWKGIGFAMILFLARLTTVDKSIYESAQIDGATDMQILRYISIPILKNIIQVYIVLQIIGLMSFLFNYVYVMTDGGPGFSSTPLEYFVYINAFKLQDMGKANAAGIFLIFFTMLIVYLFIVIMRKQRREI